MLEGFFHTVRSTRNALHLWDSANAVHRGCYNARAAQGASASGVGFGVRRPIRVLNRNLKLSDDQLSKVADAFEKFRAVQTQAAVDRHQALTQLANAVGGGQFDDAEAAQGLQIRADAAQSVRNASLQLLKDLYAIVEAGQREKLAYVIRSEIIRV